MTRRWTASQTRLLADVGDLLVSLNRIEALQQVAHHLVPLLANWCAIIIRDERQRPCRVAIAAANPANQPLADYLTQQALFIEPMSVPAQVLTSNRPLLLTDLNEKYIENPQFSPAYREILRRIRPRHILGVPISFQEVNVGALVLTISTPSRRCFSTNDIELVTELARRMAISVENILLYRSTQRRLEQLLIVQRVAALVNSTLQTDRICHLVVEQLHTVFGYHLVSIYLLQEGALHLQAAIGYDNGLSVIQLHEGVAGRVMRSGQAEFVRDASLDPDFLEVIPGTTQCIIVPLRYEHSPPVGVIIIESTGEPVLDDEDFFLLSLLADQISVAFFNATLFDRLYEANDRFRSLIELAGSLVIYLDAELRITEFNPMAEQMFGRTRASVIGQSFATTLLSMAEQPLFAALVREVVASRSRRSFESSFWLHGQKHWVEWSMACRCDPNGKVVEFVLVGQDITGQREKALALIRDEQRFQMIERLESIAIMAGGIAHDFNNLLNIILHNADTLQTTYSAQTLIGQHLQHIISATQQAVDLVQQLLSLAGQRSSVVQRINLNSLINEVVSPWQSSLGKNIRVQLELEPALPEIMVDLVQIRQVLMNLLVNAAEALPEGHGSIRIQTGLRLITVNTIRRMVPPQNIEPGQYLFLSVHDDGIGIDPTILSRIFEPFFTTKQHGHGLGLAGVFQIVQRHNGALTVDSRPVQGSTFTVWLPVSSSTATRPTLGVESNHTILVIDDNPEIRTLTERILTRAGYQVLAFNSGRDALKVIAERTIACALVDVTLADMHGYEVCRQIAALNPNIPLALVSGYLVDAAHLVDVPVVATLQKPFRAEELLTLVRRLIAKDE